MAIIKKKMAGKPMMKNRKAKDGTNVAKSDTTSMYNKKTDTQEIKKPLNDVPVRPGFKGLLKENLDKWMSNRDSTEYQNTKAKTTAGKVIRGANKVASTAARAIMSPLTVTASTVGAGVKAGVNAIKNKQDLKKIPEKKMGGKVAPKMMMMKKMSKKK